MVLQRQTIDIPIGQGIDELSSKGSIAPGKLEALVNGRFDLAGAIETRNGFTKMPNQTTDATTIEYGHKIFTAGNELIMSDAERAYQWLHASSKWQDFDYLPEAAIEERFQGVRGSGTQGCKFDSIINGNIRMIAWVEDAPYGQSYYDVRAVPIDVVTGTRYPVVSWQATGVQSIRLASAGSRIYVLFCHNASIVGGADIRIKAAIYDTATPDAVWGGTTELADDLQTTMAWDACGTGTNLWLSYGYDNGAGTTGVKVKKFNATLTTFDSTVSGPGNVAGPMAISAKSNGLVYVAWEDATIGALGILCFALRPADLTFAFPYLVVKETTDIDLRVLSIGQIAGGGCMVAWESQRNLLSGAEQFLGCATVSTTGTKGNEGKTYRLAIGSTVFSWENRYYIVGTIPEQDNFTQYGAFLLELVTGTSTPKARVVTRLVVSQCGFHLTTHPPNLMNDGSSTLAYSVEVALPILSNARRGVASATYVSEPASLITEGCDVYRIRFWPSTAPLSTIAGTQLVLSGGVPSAYDGIRIAELGSHLMPAMKLQSVANSGVLDFTKTYSWTAIYVTLDAKGTIQRSAPATPVFWSNSGYVENKKATLRIEPLSITEQSDLEDPSNPVEIHIYRSMNGSGYHLVDKITNNPAVPYIDYVDGDGAQKADAVIAYNQLLYTDGGVVENIAPPCAKHIAYHDNRIWLVSADNPDTIWFSKIHISGELPGFNESLRLQLPSGDPITAISAWDEKLIIFTAKSIWLVFGVGPNDMLQGSQYTDPPRLHSSELGCVDPRSVVHGPGGIYFQAESGLWQLNQGLKPIFVGAPVVETFNSYPTVLGATSIERDREVRFLCANSVGDTVVLVHNYSFDQWSKWTLPKTDGAHSHLAAIAAGPNTSDQTISYILQTDGYVLKETPETFVDPDGSFITMDVTFGWLHLAGIQGYQRVRQFSVIGDYLSKFSASASFWFDYEEPSVGAPYSYSWTDGYVTAATDNGKTQLQVHMPKQKCQSVKVRLVITPTLTPASGMRIFGLAAEVGVMPRPYRTGSGNKPPTAAR